MGGALLMVLVCAGVGLALAFLLHSRVSPRAGWAVPMLAIAGAALGAVVALDTDGTAGIGWGVWVVLGLLPAIVGGWAGIALSTLLRRRAGRDRTGA